jgi:hypothetical protein
MPRPAEELFDVRTDPHQLKNVASEKVEKLNELRAVMDAWIVETRDCVSSDPTPDRQDAYGKRNPEWHFRIQPGIEAGSLESNNPGPVRGNDVFGAR